MTNSHDSPPCPRPRAYLRAFAALVVLLAGFSRPAGGETLDPGVPARLHTSLAKGFALGERIDPEGRNQSSVALPKAPRVAWQARVTPPVHGAPLAGADGSLIVAHGRGRLSELDATGRTRWSVRTGLELAGGPLLLGGGLRVAIGQSGDIVAVSPAGRVAYREKLAWGEFEGTPIAAPARDGGAILATGARLSRLGPRAAVVWSATTPDPLRAVFEWRGQALAVGRNGGVLVRSAAGEPEEIANFRAAVGRAALAGDRLFAIVGTYRVVELDLVTRTQRSRFSDPTLGLHELALGVGATPRLLSARGVLVSLDAADRELLRLGLVAEGGGGEPAGLLVDPAGTVLAAFAGAPLVLVTAQGDA
ncbi:MAG TPA: PQQ-binding-like beta-propeller repeat protein, partial [Polyangiaceae bacterium]